MCASDGRTKVRCDLTFHLAHLSGYVAERLKASVLKTGSGAIPLAGSNPAVSAKTRHLRRGVLAAGHHGEVSER